MVVRTLGNRYHVVGPSPPWCSASRLADPRKTTTASRPSTLSQVVIASATRATVWHAPRHDAEGCAPRLDHVELTKVTSEPFSIQSAQAAAIRATSANLLAQR